MSAWAKPGVKCVCISWNDDAAWSADAFGIKPLALNAVYTIRQVVQRPGGTGFLLEELDNKENPLFDFEMAYDAQRFRPLVEQSQDVELFRSLLTDLSVGVDA